jgi:hypothetical protein
MPVATSEQPVAAASPVSGAHPAPRADDPPKAAEARQQGGAAFRETLWFKQGDVEQMVAAAKAKMKASGQPASAEAPEVAVDARPLEDRYADDGSVTVEDRKKFSLRTGSAGIAVPAAVTAPVPGEKIDEKQMVGEISGGRRTLILIIAAVVILALVVVVAMMVKSKGKSAIGRDDRAALMATSPASSGAWPGQPQSSSPDADTAPGGPALAGTGTTAGGALGSAGGATKPEIGGATSEAKKAKKVSHAVSQPKKRLAAKHVLQKGRQHQTRE